jgi:hypothetical protein
MDNRDLDFAASKLYFTMTGQVPSPHFPGTCVTLTGRECDDCEVFRKKVHRAMTNLIEVLDKLIEATPD